VSKWFVVILATAGCVGCGAPAENNAAPAGAAAVAEPAPTPAVTPVSALAEAAPAPPRAAVVREVIIPVGTTLRLDLASSVASDSSRVEDSVRATLRQAVAVKGETILPAGTELSGVVTDVAGSARVKGRARVAYRFSSLRHDGERYDIKTSTVAHQAAATKGEDATKIAIGAGAGAALGAILGGGDGAAKGAAIGGAGGTGVVLATKGKEVRLGPGANVTTKLTAPLTVRVKS